MPDDQVPDPNGGGNPAAPPPYLPHIQLPPQLDVDSPGMRERWLDWREDFERYLLLSGAGQQVLLFQSSALLQSIGYEARRIYKGFVYSDAEDKTDPAILLQKYDEYFVKETRDFVERLVFSRREQGPQETFEQFLSALRFLAVDCDFCNATCRDARIMDRIISGNKNQHVKDKLMSSAKLDLKAALIICRSMELDEETQKVVGHAVEAEVAKLSLVPKSRLKNSEKSEKLCNFCIKVHLMGKVHCPAWGKICNACDGENHFSGSRVCPANTRKGHSEKRSAQKVHFVQEGSDSESTEGSVSVVNAGVPAICNSKASKAIYCKMVIDKEEVSHQIDPGATVCIIPAKYIGGRSIRDEPITLKMWNGASVSALGRVKVKVKNPKTKKNWNIDYVVVNDPTVMPLLSRNAAETMGLITVNYENFKVCTIKSDIKYQCSSVTVDDSDFPTRGPSHPSTRNTDKADRESVTASSHLAKSDYDFHGCPDKGKRPISDRSTLRLSTSNRKA